MSCPCTSGLSYKECCGKFHQGELPRNALELMRSRYAAYAKHNASYIMETTHPDNPKFQHDKKKWTKEILAFSQNTTFEGLEIVDFQEGEKIAFVTFKANLAQNGKDVSFQEKSRFEKVEDRWLYHSGELQH